MSFRKSSHRCSREYGTMQSEDDELGSRRTWLRGWRVKANEGCAGGAADPTRHRTAVEGLPAVGRDW